MGNDKVKKPKGAALRLKNYQIVNLVKWLDIPLHGQESRARHRFLKLVSDRLEEYEKFRHEYIKELATKDDKGNPRVSIDGRTYVFSTENRKVFDQKVTELNDEELAIDILESTRDTIHAMRSLVLGKVGERSEFDALQGRVYDEVCSAFEAV